MTMVTLTPQAWLSTPSAHREWSPLTGTTGIVLDGDWAGLDEASTRPWPPPVPLIARLRGDEGGAAAAALAFCDVVIAEVGTESEGAVGGGDAVLEALVSAVAATPIAASVLCQTLRSTELLEVEPALLVESMAYSTLQGGPEFSRWVAARSSLEPSRPDLPPTVIGRREGDELMIELNRPAVHNALNTVMRDELVTLLDLAEADATIRAVCLTGRGPSFCAGGDLHEFGTATDPATAHAVRSVRLPARTLARVADRVTARVHGSVIGAGVELAAFAGQVQARPDAVFRLPEVSMGLVPGAGGTVSLPRRIGRQRTAYLALAGAQIDVVTATAWGLVDQVIMS
jgi:enoyl-CoA hydratase